MKVFISWSGDTSKNIAEIFRQWLPSVIQVVKPYYSPDDITKGTRWSSEIAKELDESKLGLICLTRDNLQSPWIMFEAGALSKNIDKSKVCPLLFGVDPSDIEGPLIQFQAAKFGKDEMKKVVKMMNHELGEHSLSVEVLDNVFEMWWPRLNEKIEAELSKAVKNSKKDLRSDRDIMEEVLNLARNLSISSETNSKDRAFHPRAIMELSTISLSVINSLNKGEIEDVKEHLQRLRSLIKMMIFEFDLPSKYRNEARRNLVHMTMLLDEFQDAKIKFMRTKQFYVGEDKPEADEKV
jgi:TIR domain